MEFDWVMGWVGLGLWVEESGPTDNLAPEHILVDFHWRDKVTALSSSLLPPLQSIP